MQELRFIVPAIPVAQPRPRHVRTKSGAVITVSALKGDPVHDFKASCRMAAWQAHRDAPLDGPICVTVVCVFPRKKTQIWKLQAMPRLPHCVRPDCDNVAKSVLDALTGIVWRDDKQIYELRVLKQVAAGDEQPHCEVRVRTED